MAENAPGMTTESALPALDDDGAARHLVTGLELPDLALPSSRGERVNLSTPQGRGGGLCLSMDGAAGRRQPAGMGRHPRRARLDARDRGFPRSLLEISRPAHRGVWSQQPIGRAPGRADLAPRRAVSAAERCELCLQGGAQPADLRCRRHAVPETADAVRARWANCSHVLSRGAAGERMRAMCSTGSTRSAARSPRANFHARNATRPGKKGSMRLS